MYPIKKCLSIAPLRIFVALTSAICSAGISVLLTLVFYRTVLSYVENLPGNSRIGGFLLISTLIFALLFGYNIWYEQVFKPKSDQAIKEKLSIEIFTITENIPIEYYEDSEFYDDYLLITQEYPNRFISSLDTMQMIVRMAVSIFSFLGFMIYLDAVPLIFVPAIVLLVFLFRFVSAKLQFKLSTKRIKDEKVIEYIKRVVYLPQYAKELRVTPVFSLCLDYFETAITSLKKTAFEFGRKIAVLSFLSEFLGEYFPLLFAASYLIYSICVKQTLTVADYASAALALTNLVRLLTFVIDIVTRYFENDQYLKKATNFVSFPTASTDEEQKHISDDFTVLSIESLSFKYRSQKEAFLRDVSMEINRGQKIALVGENGSGKSTLVKVLLNFYNVESGKILLNGVPVKNYDTRAYRSYFGVLFQDFQLYATSLRNNISMGGKISDEKIIECLNTVGMDKRVSRLPAGLDTVYSKEFDSAGALFSGGEAQRIALARLYALDKNILILDEPSSALDPILERQLFDMVYDGMREKTVLFISHRLSCTVRADHIYVMNDGTIVESGNHKSLMKKEGHYYKLFNQQAKMYV